MSPLLRLIPLVVLLAVAASGQELNEKAARYYETLRKRPAAGPVFDRFVDAWLDTGTLEQLETFLSDRIKAEPSAAGHLLLGLYHVRQGAHAKAVEQYRAALTLEPANAVLWQQKALAEARLLEFDQAIVSLQKGLEQKPAEELSLTMRQLLGRLLSRAGRTDEALKVWQELMKERPDDEALREDVLDLQLAEGLYDAAVENAAALVERAPDAYKKAMRRLQSAEVLDRASRTDGAMAELERCLADSGADSWLEKEVLARLDRIFRRDDNLSGLRAHLEALAQRQPQRHGVQRARVRLLAEIGEKSAAVEAGRVLLALAPGDRVAREEFIALLVEAGRLEEAVAQTAELVRQAPQDRELLLKLAALKLQAGDKPGCLAAVTEFDKLSGADEAARLRSAALLEKAGLMNDAIARLQAAAQEFPSSVAVSGALASSLHKARRRDEALAEWKRIATAASGPAFQDVARALSAHGEDETAWELLLTKASAAETPLLTQLCQLAERLDRSDEALPHARRLVSLAQSAPDMEAALEMASRLIKRAGEADSVIASIGADAGVADLCLLAELLEMRGDSSAAEDALNRAAQASPDMAAAQLVRLYRLRQAWPQALEAGAKLFAAPGGKKAATAQMLAEIAERSRDLEAALHWTREWRKLSPGAAPAVLAESRLLRTMGKDDEALKTLRLASGQFEENREIRLELARLSRDTGKTSEALSLYAGLYEQSPEAFAKLRIVREWAEAALETNRMTEMLEQFEERRRQNRNATAPLLALAEIHAVNGDREKQRRALTDAARLRPEDADLALSLAAMQAEDDLIPLAMDTLRAALPHDKSGRVRHRLARLHFDAGDQAAGMKLLEEPEDGTPPDAAAVESMAIAIMPTDPERALALLEPRIAADSGDYRLRFLRAAIQAELGQHAEAVREWSALLGIDQESPTVMARQATPLLAQVEARMKSLSGIVPEELLQIVRIHELRVSTAQQVNYQQNSGAYRMTLQLELPANLAEMHALTTVRLLNLGNSSEEASALVAAATKELGLNEIPGLLASLPEEGLFGNHRGGRNAMRFGNLQGDDVPKVGPSNDSVPARGLRFLMNLLSTDTSPARTDAKVVWNTWEESHPEFALAGGLVALEDNDEPDDWEAKVVESFLGIERPGELILKAAGHYLKYEQASRWDEGRTHTAILERIAGWLDTDWMMVPAMNPARRQLVQGFLTMKLCAPEVRARVINNEWPREERTGKAVGPATVSGWVNYSPAASGSSLLAPLTWPPSELPGVSPVFTANTERLGFAGDLPRATAEKLIPLASHATLRAWLEDRLEMEKHPLPLVTKLAGDSGADSAALVLAALSAAEAEQYAQAAGFAQRALERPLSTSLRRTLNASIVSWADEAMADHGSLLHTAAREAALRLRRDAQSYEQKAELAEAMELLGLTAEAKALTSGGGMNLWAQYGARFYNMRSVSGAGRVQTMMREAKRELTSGSDAAATTAAKVVRRQARYLLSPAGWDGGFIGAADGRYFSGSTEDDVNWPDLLKLMQDEARSKAILDRLQSETGSEPRQRAVLAAAHEFFEKTDRAVALYREVLAAGSEDPGVSVRLMRLLCQPDRDKDELLPPAFSSPNRPSLTLPTEIGEEVTGIFVAAPPEAQEWMTGALLYGGEREPLDKVLRVTAMNMAGLMKPNSPGRNVECLTRLLTLLREDLVLSENLRAPKLDGPQDGAPVRRPNRPDASPEELQQAQQQLAARRTAHESLCRRLLSVPGAAAVAFHSLRAVAPQDTVFAAEAVTAFVAESGGTPATAPHLSALSRQQQIMLRLTMADRADGDGFSLIEPPVVTAQDVIGYLLAHCTKSNSPEALRANLIPALEKAGVARLAEQMSLLTAIYFDAPEQVEANARRLAAAGGTAAWPAVIRGMEHRRSGADLSALVVGEVTRARSRPDDLPAAVSAAGDYCAWLCRAGRHPQARLLLERVLDVLTGTQRQRAAAFSGAVSGGFNQYLSMFGGSTGQGSPPAAEAIELLKRLIATPSAAFVALDTVYESIMPALPSDTASALTAQLEVVKAPFTKGDFFTDAERARQLFTGSPLAADVEKFRSYGGGSGLFFTVAGALYEMGFEERKPALEVLRTLPPAFGRDVLIAAASDRWNAEALNIAAAHFSKIAALPPPAQTEIADLLAALASGRDLLKLTDVGHSLMQWVGEQQSLMMGEETAKRIEAFVSTGSTAGGNMFQRQDPAAAGAPLLQSAIKGMSPRAYDVVRRVSVLVPRPEAPETMGSLLAGYDSRFALVRAESGGGLTDGVTPLPPDRAAFRLGLLTNTMAAADKRAPLFIEPLRLALPRTVRWISARLTGTPEEKLTALTTALAAHVKEGEACVLLEALPLPVSKSDTPESRAALRAAAIAWADGAGKSQPRQDIVREIAAAARLEEFMENQPRAAGISDESLLPPEQAHYLSVMRDESRGPTARLAVASLLADFAGPWLEPPLLAQTAGILERTITARRPLDDWQRTAIVRAVSRSTPSPATDAAAQSLLARLPFNENLKGSLDRAAAKHYLSLALRLNDSPAVVKSLAALQSGAGDPDVLGMILATGDAVRIANIVRDAEEKNYEPTLCGGEVMFDDRVAAHLPAALAAASDEALELHLELAAHSLPSAPGVKSRTERLAEVVARMEPLMESLPQSNHDALLDMLTVEPAAALPLIKYAEASCSKVPPQEIVEGDPTDPKFWQTRLWLLCLFADAANGDVPGLTERFALLEKSPADPFATPSVSPHPHALRHLCTGIAHGWPQWDATKRTAVQQWIIGRLNTETLPAADTHSEELSSLPVELIEAINKAVP
jgi:tetratricopeptide (TPR) repeat protein